MRVVWALRRINMPKGGKCMGQRATQRRRIPNTFIGSCGKGSVMMASFRLKCPTGTFSGGESKRQEKGR